MSATDLPGPSLLAGRYRLVERLGAGGMSVVWRGFDEVLGRQVAVKVLPRANSVDPSFRRRLRAEAQAAARLSHPHITNVYDYGEAMPVGGSAPVPFVVMELIDGESLAAILGRVQVLPWAAAVRICADVAAALAAAHTRGIVHRDVTPANVMLTPSGAKVVDFGISALIGENDIDPDGSLLGTPAYLAPERLIGGQVSPATDVYAVGLLIYRALIGQLPWDVGTTTALLRAHQYTEPEPLPEVEGLPPAVYALVGRCLEKLPDDRPSSAELAHVLAGIVAELPRPAATRGPWDDEEGDTTILPWQHGTADVHRAAAAALHRPSIDPERPGDVVGPPPAPRRPVPTSLEVGAVRPAAFDQVAAGGVAPAGALGAPAAMAASVPAQRAGEREQDVTPIVAQAGSGHCIGPGGGSEQDRTSRERETEPVARHGSAASGRGAAQQWSTVGDRDPRVLPERAGSPAQGRVDSGGYAAPDRTGGPVDPPVKDTASRSAGSVPVAAGQARRAAVRRRVFVATTGAAVAVGAAGYGWSAWDGAARGNGSALAASVERSCFVTYSVLSDKADKFTAGVLVTNNSSQPVHDWSLRFVMPGDQRLASAGEFTLTQQGHDVTAASSEAIEPLRTTQLNVVGGYRHSNPVPMLFTLNGQLCQAFVSATPGGTPASIPNIPGTSVDDKGFPVPAPNAVPSLSTGPNGVVTVTVTPVRTASPTVAPATTDPVPLVTTEAPTTTTPPPPSPPPANEEEPPPPPTDEEPPPPPLDDEPPSEDGLLESIIGELT